MSNTNWTDTPPNTPGWYWVRNQNNISISYFPSHGVYPTHWADLRQNTIDTLREDGEVERATNFESLDLKLFIKEYNGPIFPPN